MKEVLEQMKIAAAGTPLFDGVKYYPHEEGNSVSDKLFEDGLCLPSGSNMSVEDQERVIDVIFGLLVK